jgi:glycosyltransferase involved in cell wall biosynthesis
MASYNGEKYIGAQIDSLLNQTVQDFRLFICDDLSTDSTFSIIQDYLKKYPDKIFISQNTTNSGGSKHNFFKMMAEHKDDYVLLCDQDDVWLSDKIEKSLCKITEMEVQYGKSMPLLVHTDLTVVDENLDIISPSFMMMNKARFERNKLNDLVIQNILTGCSIMYNRALADLILNDEPEYMFMHDWWLALIAGAFGKIDVYFGQTALYRQHECNVFGANKRGSGAHFFHKLLNFGGVSDTLNDTYRQAGSFLALYKHLLTPEYRELITAYSSIPEKSKIDRVKILFKYGTWKNGLIRRVAQIIAI